MDEEKKVEPEEQAEWTEEQLAMFPELEFISKTDEQLGLPMNTPEAEPDMQMKLWAKRYCLHFNKTRATMEAGYSDKPASAAVIGCRLYARPVMKRLVGIELEGILTDSGASKAALIQKLKSMLHGSDIALVSQFLRGIENITLDDLAKLPPEVSAGIKSINIQNRTTDIETESGNRHSHDQGVKIDLHDGKAVAELIAKIQKHLDDDPTISLNLDITNMSPEDRRARIAELRAKDDEPAGEA